MNVRRFDNIMVDLETMSNKTNATIIEIGLVEFDEITGEIGKKLDLRIDPNDWENQRGGHISGRTIAWWMLQSDEARKRFVIDDHKGDISETYLIHDGGKAITNTKDALYIAKEFIRWRIPDNKEEREDFKIWGNGSVYDLSILQNAFERFGMEIPWLYWMANDVRTIVNLYPSVKKEWVEKRNTLKHSAIDDCIFQIGYLSETIRMIKNYPLEPYDTNMPLVRTQILTQINLSLH